MDTIMRKLSFCLIGLVCSLSLLAMNSEKEQSFFSNFSRSIDYNGVTINCQIISESEKTVQIGNGKVAAIPVTTSGAFSIPSSVILDGITYEVVSIADSAFYACNKLTSVSIPSSIKSSGANAFWGCSGLQKVIVLDLTAWCSVAFTDKYSNPLYYANHLYSNDNTEIKDLVIPQGVTEIGSFAFVKSLINSVIIPGSVSTIGSYAFYKCTSLKSAMMNEGLDRIRKNAFYGCTALSSVMLPEGMRRIGDNVFYGCIALETIEFPASLVGTEPTYPGVGANAFNQCINLREVKSNVEQPTSTGENAFVSIASDAVLYIPVGKMEAYIKTGWTNAVFGGGVVEVGDVEENYCLENGVTKGFIQNVVYPDDDYSFTRITDFYMQNTSYRKDLPRPVRIEIPVVKEGKALILETSANDFVVRSDTFYVGQKALEIWNLIPRTQYAYKLYVLEYDGENKNEIAVGCFTTEGQVRMLDISDVPNFRDIGGWATSNGNYVKYDRLFRSAELATTSQIITAAGIEELIKIQGVGVEIDFASAYNSESPVSGYLEHVHGIDYQIEPYKSGLKQYSLQYKNCFEKLVNSLREGKKVLFHCHRGADRTGTFAFLLEGLLGV